MNTSAKRRRAECDDSWRKEILPPYVWRDVRLAYLFYTTSSWSLSLVKTLMCMADDECKVDIDELS